MEDSSKYVNFNGRVISRHLLKPVRKNLVQAGMQEVQYELDEQKVFDAMLEFGELR
ncbi:MAG: hypothetical protein ACREAS_00555 [Nitrososphaera sp.]|jgi:hypothetical protein